MLVHRKEGLDVLFRAAKETLLKIWREKRKGVPGIIAVIHTFGGDLKWNPHVHVIVTCGGLVEEERWEWMDVDYVPFKYLRQCWRYHVIDGVRQWAKGRYVGKVYTKFNGFLDFLYRKEWYVNAGERLESLEFTVKYIGRYAKRPVIAETRLKEFDGETVVFSHKDKVRKQEVEIRLPVMEFIGKLVRHIPGKNHRMIRYSGIFANRVKRKMLGLVRAAVVPGAMPMFVAKPVRSWRERMRSWMGIDPYQCSCGRMMELVYLAVPRSTCVVRVKEGGMMVIRGPPFVSGMPAHHTPSPTTHSSVG